MMMIRNRKQHKMQQCLQEITTQFLSTDGGQDDCKYIHVEQGECAHVRLHNEPDSGVRLLSHAATTCVICVLHCASRRQSFIAHMDGSSSSDVAEMVAALDAMLHVRAPTPPHPLPTPGHVQCCPHVFTV